MPVAKLTKSYVDSIDFTGEGQELHWDSGLKGFGIRIGTGSKSFVVQKSGKGIKTIGRYGVLTVAQARQRAQDILADIINDRLGQAPRLTLRKAMHDYVRGMKNRGRAPRSIADLEYRLENYLADWLDRIADCAAIDLLCVIHTDRRCLPRVRARCAAAEPPGSSANVLGTTRQAAPGGELLPSVMTWKQNKTAKQGAT